MLNVDGLFVLANARAQFSLQKKESKVLRVSKADSKQACSEPQIRLQVTNLVRISANPVLDANALPFNFTKHNNGVCGSEKYSTEKQGGR